MGSFSSQYPEVDQLKVNNSKVMVHLDMFDKTPYTLNKTVENTIQSK